MSGSEPFSKHLLDSYQACARASHTPYSTYHHGSISMHGATPFNPTMHGTYHPQDAFSCTPNDSAFKLSADTEMKLAALQAKLNQRLGPEYISTRPGGNGMKLTYTEGWKVINLANEVFGFNGWSTAVVNVTCDFADYDPKTQRHSIGIAAIVRVTLRDGVYHEDIGYGMMENSKSKAAAFDKCRKEAVTDALKRALRNFGNLLGNCLYDKEYTREIQKIKPPPPPKLDKDSLHRRPEFTEQKPDPGLIKSTAGPSSIDHNPNPNHRHAPATNDQSTKLEPVTQQPSGPNTTINDCSAQPNTTTDTTWKAKIPPQQNNSRPTPNAGNTTNNVYRPPPPKKQPSNPLPVVPKQQPQQPAAKPDNAEPATIAMDVDHTAGEDDMSFFESEDDKWMMGDFDIDLDVDLGRPIDFEADESVTNQDDSGFLDAKFSGNVEPRKGTTSASAQRNDGVSVSGHNSNSVQRPGGSDSIALTGVNPNGNGKKEVSFQPLPNVRSSGNAPSNGNGNNRVQRPSGPNGNGGRANLPNSTSTVQPSSSGNSRPSAGGFSFPPGTNQSGIGLKRPAESMLQHPQQQPGGSGFKRVSTGMGLSAMSTNGNGTAKREPLGTLFAGGEDAGGGGPDPKRMRR